MRRFHCQISAHGPNALGVLAAGAEAPPPDVEVLADVFLYLL